MDRVWVKEKILLYGITDRTWLNGERLYNRVEEALKGGVSFLQLREKEIPKEEILGEAVELKGLCRKYDVPLIINDDVELAVKSDADGVHVGQKDMDVREARKLLGPDKILGVSARTVEQAVSAEKFGADYLGCGDVFGTATKKDAGRLELNVLKDICNAVSIPVVAIGGIKSDNIIKLKGSGISGIAVISAVFGKNDAQSAAAELRKLAENIIN